MIVRRLATSWFVQLPRLNRLAADACLLKRRHKCCQISSDRLSEAFRWRDPALTLRVIRRISRVVATVGQVQHYTGH
jgi:hypothetical protein